MIIGEGQPKDWEEDLSSLQGVRFEHIVFGLCSVFLLSIRERGVYQTRTEQWLWSPNTTSDISIYCSQNGDCRP
jgi:hypothetical protein